MRFVVLACVVLAGCGPGQFYSPERINQRIQQGAAERAQYAASPIGQAEATCEMKVSFAMAGNPIRHSLDVAGVVRQQQMQAQCMDYWQRTGQFP